MGGKNGNYQKKNQKDNTDSIQDAQKLYKKLRKNKVPTTLAVLICAAVVGFGVWTGTRPADQSGQQAPKQTTQTQEQKSTENPGSQQQKQADGQEISYTFRTQEQLEDHFERHGIEMGFEDEDAYVAGANRVIASPDALHKLEAEDGDDVYYIEETNEFVVVSKDGFIRTYFEPDDGLAYYERQ